MSKRVMEQDELESMDISMKQPVTCVSPFVWAAALTSWSAANPHTWLSRCQRSSHCETRQRDALLGGKENKLAGVKFCFSFRKKNTSELLMKYVKKNKRHLWKTMQNQRKYTDCIENIVTREIGHFEGKIHNCPKECQGRLSIYLSSTRKRSPYRPVCYSSIRNLRL